MRSQNSARFTEGGGRNERRRPIIGRAAGVSRLILTLGAMVLLTTSLSSDDSIIVQVEDGTSDGAGFDVMSPGPHDLTITLQAIGAGNEINSSMAMDMSGWVMWAPMMYMTPALEHSYFAGGVTGNDLHAGEFMGDFTQGGWFNVYSSFLDLDASNNEPSMCGMGGEPCVPDDDEATTGVGVPITLPGTTTLPATLPSTQSGHPLWLTLSKGYNQSGSLDFTVTGSGAAIYIYDSAQSAYAKVDAPIPVGSGGYYGAPILHTNDNFTGDVTIEARFEHDNGETDAADEVKVYYQAPPVFLADLDVDTNEDGSIDEADDPDEENVGIFIQLDDVAEAKLALITPPAQDLFGYQVLIDVFEGAGLISLWDDPMCTIATTLAPTGYDASPTGGLPFPAQIYIRGDGEGTAKVRMRLVDPMGMEVDSDMVAITIGSVDLDIHNGHGAATAVQEQYEDDAIGVFTVPNLNDTDGDGEVDKDDMNGVTGEVDLMKLVIWKPKRDTGGNVTLKVVSGNVKLWSGPTKQPAESVALTGGELVIPVSNISTPAAGWYRTVLWVELTAGSTNLRDVELKLTYNGKSDSVKATGIWATKTGFKNQLTDTLWADAGDPLRTTFTEGYEKFGIQYSTDPFIQVQYAMGMEFTIKPSATVEQWNNWHVKFDVTRQKEYRIWGIVNGNFAASAPGYWQGRTSFTSAGPTGTHVDKATDDADPADQQSDEDNAPLNDHIYSIDGPGHANDGMFPQYVVRTNFLEFVRIKFDGDPPAENVTSGSRCSPKIPWHVHIWSEKEPATGNYRERPGKGSEVAEGYKSITPAPVP